MLKYLVGSLRELYRLRQKIAEVDREILEVEKRITEEQRKQRELVREYVRGEE